MLASVDTPVVQFKNVQKKFADKCVIEKLNLQVYSGEVVALLGVNGAGKTTTINLILGLELPTAGEVFLNGGNPAYYQSRANIGITPQDTEFPEVLTTAEILQFVAQHYAYPQSVSTIAEQFQLTNFLAEPIAVCSGGQKRRLAVALAFIGNPKVVFLDEPTTGLDIKARQQVWEQIRAYAKSGGTVFLTTHYLEEAEALATRIIMLHQGAVRADGSVNAIKALTQIAEVQFKCAQPLPALTHMVRQAQEAEHWQLYTREPDALIRELVAKQVAFQDLSITRGSLEAAFMQLAGEA